MATGQAMPEQSPAAGAQRLFFALWPPASQAGTLAATAVRLVADCAGRATRRDTLHLTLAFLGATPDDRLAAVRDAGAAAAAMPSFDFVLDRIGWWQHNRIVWAGCSEPPAELPALAGRLGSELRQRRLPGAVPDFRPHVTLLRKASRPPASATLAPLPWPVGELLLVSSVLAAGGPAYRCLARWPLGGGERLE